MSKTEITRSFSFKLNVGNYESRDFFMAQKAECSLDEAEKISEQLHEFCKSEVLKSVNEYKKKLNERKNMCKVCGGIVVHSDEGKKLNAEGLCEPCATTKKFSNK